MSSSPSAAGREHPYTAAPFFAFRTPLLPFDVLTRWGEGLGGANASPEERKAALANDRARLGAALRAIVERPDVREALFVASPSLDDAIQAWLRDPESSRAKGVVEIVTRYLLRMAARSTPFGLFSGCSVGSVADKTSIVLAADSPYRRHTRLDMHYLCALTEALEKDPDLRRALRYRPNSGMYSSGAQLRYAEARVDATTRERSHHLVSVDRTDYLERALDRARSGARTSEIAKAIVDGDPSVADEAPEFVETLIDSQVIVSDLTPTVTGESPIVGVIAKLREAGASVAADALGEVDRALRSMDDDGLGLSADRYRAVASALEALPAKADMARLFQVDLFKTTRSATIGPGVIREIRRGIEFFSRFERGGGEDAISRFSEAFTTRFDQREVPLVEALDEERGVGFDGSQASAEPSPLLEDIVFPSAESEGRIAFGARAAHLVRRHAELARAGTRVWELDESDVQVLADPKNDGALPDAFAVFATIVASSAEAVDRGDFKLLFKSASGPSGAPLLGRFCLGDDALRKNVEEHLRAEEALEKDAIFAEIVHLPEGRMGNILCRPVMRGHEIAYLGRSSAPEEMQIAVTDLLVSVRGGRITLRSQKHGKEVLPRLTSAHNYSSAELGIYRFLCALQSQGRRGGLGWDWGPLAGSAWVPRVTYKNLILSVESWTLAKKDLAKLGEGDADDRFAEAQKLRAQHRLPRWVGVADGDNVLPVDLDNAFSVETFAQLLKGRSQASLRELYPGAEDLVVEGEGGGRYVHEIVVPFTRTPIAAPKPERVAAAESSPRAFTIARSLPPGSSWLYAKLYTGTASADHVITDVLGPLVDQAIESGAADRWFFIRYGDPDWHLRLRFSGDPKRLLELVPELHRLVEPFALSGTVFKVQLDTYEREVERYGGDRGMELSEAMFRADSDLALAIVRELHGDEGSDARWRLALVGMQRILVELGLDLDARIALLDDVRTSFAREHNTNAMLERALGAKFRKERASLEPLLAMPDDPEHPLALGFEAIRVRSEAHVPIAKALREAEAKGELTQSIASLAGSYLHMHANRLLRSEQRRQELVLYDFLYRLNDSERARSKKKAAK